MKAARWFFYLLLGVFFYTCVVYLSSSWREIYAKPKDFATTSPHSQWVETASGDLYVDSYGPKKKGLFLILPGGGTWSQQWNLVQTTLDEAGYRSMVLDLPPFGPTARELNYTPVAQAQKVMDLLEAQNLSQVVLVAHSYQADTALEALVKDQEKPQRRIKSLMFINPLITLNDDPKDFPHPVLADYFFSQNSQKAISSFLSNPVFCEWTLSNSFLHPWFFKHFLKATVTPASYGLLDAYEKTLVQSLKIKGTASSMCSFAQYFLNPQDLSSHTKAMFLQKADVPFFIFRGNLDPISTMPSLLRLQELNPFLSLQEIPGVSHNPQLEDPTLLSKYLIQSSLKASSLPPPKPRIETPPPVPPALSSTAPSNNPVGRSVTSSSSASEFHPPEHNFQTPKEDSTPSFLH